MNNSQKFSTRRTKVLLLTVLLLVLGSLACLCCGAEAVDLRKALFGETVGNTSKLILLYVRLPRLCACLLAGSALATAGVVIQTVLANPLAAPGTIGVNSGAGLMVALCAAIAPGNLKLVPVAALIGAFLGTMLVMTIAEKTGASRMTLVLAGMAISTVFSAGIDAVVTFVPDALTGYSDFRIGGFSGIGMNRLKVAVWPIVIGIVLVWLLRNELDLLMLGTDRATSLGLPAKKMRILLLALASLLAGAAVSFAGLLGFVGLIIPHIMRKLVGEESSCLLPASMLGGATVLTVCDTLSRTLFAPYELPVGIVMSLLGGPFFVWLLWRRKGGHR